MIMKSLAKKLTYTLESVKTFMEMIQYQNYIFLLPSRSSLFEQK